MPLNTGLVLHNRYRIVKLLAQGGFGAVYRAWDLNLGRPCAIKENLETAREVQDQFAREAVLLASLSHPNLARVFDYFIIPGQGQYLAMDFIEGDDLQQMLDQSGPLPQDQTVIWMEQVCAALIYLHSHVPPVIHRDIKPANIKITPQGNAVLVDFGIAKFYDPNIKTTRGARAVTPGFSPPEQYGFGRTDARSDIYALGATFYSLLTGQVPPESVAISAGNETLQPVQMLNPAITPVVAAAITKAMCIRPDERHQTVAEFKAALRSARPTLPGVHSIGGKAPWIIFPPVGWHLRRVGLVVLLVLGIAFGIVVLKPGLWASLAQIGATTPPSRLVHTSSATSGATAQFTGAVAQTEAAWLTSQPRSPATESPTATSLPNIVSTPTLIATPPKRANPGEPWGKIVFVCQIFKDEERDQLCIVNADGSGFRRLTSNDYARHNFPALSPDGNSIVFVSTMTGNMEIYEMGLTNGDMQQLTFGIGEPNAPEISPDGQSIVFTNKLASGNAIWKIDRDGGNPRQIYGPPHGFGWDPVWSTDGGQILFAGGTVEKAYLYIMGADGSHIRLVSDMPGLRGRSDWSPDGTTIVTYAGPWGGRQIYTFDLNGKNVRELTEVSSNNAPSFSPDGNWITFMSYRDHSDLTDGCEIYIMRVDSSNVRRLTDNDYCDWQPRWGQ